MTSKFRIRNWEEESVIYNIDTGDMHLLSSFNVKILLLINDTASFDQLILVVSEYFQINRKDAETFLENIYIKFHKLSLIE